MIFVLLGAQFCQWMWEYYMLRKQLSSIPGPKLVPFLGLTWHLAIIPREGKLKKKKLEPTQWNLYGFRNVWNTLCSLSRWTNDYLSEKVVPFDFHYKFFKSQFDYSDCLQWFNDLCSRLKSGIILTWIGTKPSVVISSPKYIEVIYTKNFKIPFVQLLSIFKHLISTIAIAIIQSEKLFFLTYNWFIADSFEYQLHH